MNLLLDSFHELDPIRDCIGGGYVQCPPLLREAEDLVEEYFRVVSVTERLTASADVRLSIRLKLSDMYVNENESARKSESECVKEVESWSD